MPTPRHLRRASLGFTLIELLTVIAIMAVLAGIVFSVGRHASESAGKGRAKAELAAIALALENYKRQHGDYPRTAVPAELLQALIGKKGPAMQSLPAGGRALLDLAHFKTQPERDPLADTTVALVDAWDNAYRYAYKVPAEGWINSSYLLYSLGPDGKDAPASMVGGNPDLAALENQDNLYANQ